MERVIHDYRPMHDATGEIPSGIEPQAAPAPRIAMIHNPRSHRNQGSPAETVAGADVRLVQPCTKEELAAELADLARSGIDLLVISGGDGTIRDVLTLGQPVFGSQWPVLAIVPQGKTNALKIDLDLPAQWGLAEAVAAYRSGKRARRRALTVVEAQRKDAVPMLGFVLGAGAFTLGIEAGQEAHRMGFFNSLAVGATAAWGVMQVLFSGNDNRWRRGTRMELAFEPSGEPMPHSRHGAPDRRHIMLASTFERLPGNIQLFGKRQAPIRLAVLDRPRRRIFAVLPAILAGWHPRWLAGAGLHHISAEAFSFDVEEPFILDGEHFPAGRYVVGQGPEMEFVTA